MTVVAERSKLGAVALIGAPVVAVLMYVVGSLLAGVLTALIVALLPPIEFILFAQGVLSVAIGMWVARRSTDVVFRSYSGRGIFIVFLVLALVLGMAALTVNEANFTLLFRELQMVALVAFAYWQFWRRDVLVAASTSDAMDSEARGLHRLWEPLAPLIGALPSILFFLMGLLQLGAVSAQVEEFAHLPGFVSFMVALFLAYVPVIGSVIGFFGAKDVWGWEWWQAGLLCFGPFALFILFGLAASAVGAARRR